MNIPSTRRGHVFSAGAPNSRRDSPSLRPPPSPPPRPPPRPPSLNFFRLVPSSPRARQSDPGRSFQDTVGYPQRIRPFIRTLLYSLHNIVPARSSSSSSAPPAPREPSARLIAPSGKKYARCHTPRYCIPYAHAIVMRNQRAGNGVRVRERERDHRAGPRRKPRDFLV